MIEPAPLALLVPSVPTAAELRPWLEAIDASGHYSNFGPLCTRLESELAVELGGGEDCEVVAVSSGTAGLELALGAWGLSRGSRVLVPALSFAASATAILRAGLVPVFADVDVQTWSLSPEIARDAVGRCDAVMPVAVFGRPQDARAWDAFTEETGLPVLIDAAGAFGNQRPGHSTIAAFSMHATKALAAGEGGFVACRDPEFARAVRLASNFGFDHQSAGHDIIERAGTNAKISEYHCAIALAALADWPTQSARRLAFAGEYAAALRGLGDRLILQDSGAPWLRSVFVVRTPSGIDAQTVAALAGHGVASRRWYWPPLHQHSAFAGFERIGDLPRTEELAEQLIGLPFHLHLPEDALSRVVEALDSVLP